MKKGEIEVWTHLPLKTTNHLMFQGRDQAPDLKYTKSKVKL